MAATHANQVETVQALIEAGADINIRDHRSDNPFLYASAEGLTEIVNLTIAAGADTRLTNRFGGTALIPAAERGHVEIVHELLARTDVDVNHVNNLGWTALLEAIILSDGGRGTNRSFNFLWIMVPISTFRTRTASLLFNMPGLAGLCKSSKSCSRRRHGTKS